MQPVFALQCRRKTKSVKSTRLAGAVRRIAAWRGALRCLIVAWGVHAQDNGRDWLTPL